MHSAPTGRPILSPGCQAWESTMPNNILEPCMGDLNPALIDRIPAGLPQLPPGVLQSQIARRIEGLRRRCTRRRGDQDLLVGSVVLKLC